MISPSTHSIWMRKSLLLRHCILTPRRLPRHQNTPISAAGYIQQYWSIRKNLKEWFVHMSIGRNHCPHSWNEIRPVQHFDQCMASFTFAWLLSKVLCSIMSKLYVSHTVILLRLNRPFFHTAIYILWCLKWNSGHLTARLPPTFCCSVQSSFILDMVGIDLGLGDNVTSVHICTSYFISGYPMAEEERWKTWRYWNLAKSHSSTMWQHCLVGFRYSAFCGIAQGEMWHRLGATGRIWG